MKIFIFAFIANFALFAALLFLGNLLGCKRRRNVRKLFDEAFRTPAVFHCGAQLRRELFLAAGDFFRGLERDCGFRPDGLNPIQRLLYGCCRSGHYHAARCVAYLT